MPFPIVVVRLKRFASIVFVLAFACVSATTFSVEWKFMTTSSVGLGCLEGF